jgi:hypothetical protein
MVNSGIPEEAKEGAAGEPGLPWCNEDDMVAAINIKHEEHWSVPPQ